MAAGYSTSEALFTHADGDPLTYRAWKYQWKAASPSADLTTHHLRHFYASALISQGATIKQVQTVMGHATAAVTLRTYTHLWPGDDDKTRLMIDNALGVADFLRTPRAVEQ
jgi:integrase